jgi:hypothetical protein
MAIIAKSSGESTFKPVTEGLHQAICSAVVDLGMQPGSDMYPAPKHQVYLRFDCVDELVEFEKDGQKQSGPARCGATYTLSLGDKSKLRPLLESWRGKKFTEQELEGFDIEKLLGVPCQVQILHSHKAGKTYANVQTVVPWPKGVEKPAAPADAFKYSPSEHDQSVYDRMPKWLQEKVGGRLANNYQELDAKDKNAPKAEPAGDFDDDIPF